MFKQVVISVVLVGAAFLGYAYLAPNAPDTLSRFGISLPALTGPSSGEPEARAPGAGANLRGFATQDPIVVTAPVVPATINDRLTSIGDGTAIRSVTVVSPAAGTLKEIAVAPGDTVAAGAVIARLDAEAERITRERAELALEDAEATLARTRELAAANAATTVQITAAELAAGNARLELQNAELALERRTITTPIGGTVGLFQVSAGNAVTPQTVVTTIEDTSEIVVNFWVPERYATAIRPGMAIETTAVARPGAVLEGVISAVDNRIDATSRTLGVKARIPNTDGDLRPGMSFSVTLQFGGEIFPSVDPLAIQWSADGAYIWTYADGTVEQEPVEIVQRNSDGVLVKSDLEAGEQVVIEGIQQLRAGASVRLLDEVLAEMSQPSPEASS